MFWKRRCIITSNTTVATVTAQAQNAAKFYGIEREGTTVPAQHTSRAVANGHTQCMHVVLFFLFAFLGTWYTTPVCVFLIGGAVSTPRPTPAYDSNKILFIEKEKGYAYGIGLLLLLIAKNFVERKKK